MVKLIKFSFKCNLINLLRRLAYDVLAPRLFFVGGRPRFLAASFEKLFLELSSLSCGDDARDAEGVLNLESFCRYFGFFRR